MKKTIGQKPKNIKQSNRKMVLDIIRKYDSISIKEITKKINLSKPTIIRIINYFLQNNIVLIIGKGESTDEGGKKPILYKFNEKHAYAISIGLLNDEICIIITDLNAEILEENNFQISSNIKFDEVIDIIINQLKIYFSKYKKESIIGLSIGCPGIINYSEGIVLALPYLKNWGKNIPLRSIIQSKLNLNCPIYIDNHVRFQIFAEKTIGIAKDKKNIILIDSENIGIGGAIIINNEIKRGEHSFAGLLGRIIVDSSEEAIIADNHSFQEKVGANKLLEKIKELKNDFQDSIIFANDNIKIEYVFDAANQKDPLAMLIMNEVIKYFAIVISNSMVVIDPDLFIIQGVFTKAGNYFLDNLKQKVESILFKNIKKNVEIVYSPFGKEIVALGGAIYAISEYFDKKYTYDK